MHPLLARPWRLLLVVASAALAGVPLAWLLRVLDPRPWGAAPAAGLPPPGFYSVIAPPAAVGRGARVRAPHAGVLQLHRALGVVGLPASPDARRRRRGGGRGPTRRRAPGGGGVGGTRRVL